MPTLHTDSRPISDGEAAKEHQRLRRVKADGAMLLFDDQEDQPGHPPRGVAEQRRQARIDAGARRAGEFRRVGRRHALLADLLEANSPSWRGTVDDVRGRGHHLRRHLTRPGRRSAHCTTSASPSRAHAGDLDLKPPDGRLPRNTATTMFLAKSTAGAGRPGACRCQSACHSAARARRPVCCGTIDAAHHVGVEVVSFGRGRELRVRQVRQVRRVRRVRQVRRVRPVRRVPRAGVVVAARASGTPGSDGDDRFARDRRAIADARLRFDAQHVQTRARVAQRKRAEKP